MKEAAEFEETEVADVPVSPLLHQEHRNKYGSVPGLEDEELAAPEELERQVFQDEFGPVLALPLRGNRNPIQPVIDENGGVDWGAFGTVDFDRGMQEFDKARYKADKLREEHEHVMILCGVVTERLPKTKYKVLKYLRKGIIELEHIVSEDMLAFARLYLRASRLQKEIRELEEASWTKRRKEMAALFA